MSLVGNFTLADNERTTQNTGAQSREDPYTAHNARTEDSSTIAASSGSDRSGHKVDTPSSALQRLNDEHKGQDLQARKSHEQIEDERRDDEIHQLARRITSQSNASATSGFGYAADANPFEGKPDSMLDPTSKNFNPKAWSKALLNLQARDPERYKGRTAGFAFRDLSAFGYGSATDYQKSVGNYVFEVVGMFKKLFRMEKPRRIDILRNMDGVVNDGEMLVVLGPPGSGCSTFLKTIAGETHGFYLSDDSHINYQGIAPKQMHTHFRGEAIYTAEVDVHFPQISVGNTLSFAAKARSPRHIPGGLSRTTYSNFLRDVIMATFGISHTVNTVVGNDFIRGVSGGERKRVTIAEAALVGAPLQCWDNSTRGLDSANAIEFVKTLRTSNDLVGTTACVAIYQSPQSAYDIFDKALVLYEGRQIYFGPTTMAKQYFERMGFHCPDRQTTPDFLTSMTSPLERVIKDGFEGRTPRTPDEFAERWKNSSERARLLVEIEEYDQKYSINGEYLEKFKESRRAQQSKRQRVQSPYTLSYYGQTMLCLERGFKRLIGDPSLTFTQLFGNVMMGLIVASVFYNLPKQTSSFFQRGSLLFFAVLLNAFGSSLEILTLYAQRPIVEKQARYAMYHPSCESLASMLTDLPYKIVNAIIFNIVLYFMTNLKREPGAFFFYLLITFFLTLGMSSLFRTIGSVSRTLAQALAPTAVLLLAIVIYTGFALPIPYMHGWARWINYVDLVSYGFEALMINEFVGVEYGCSSFLPQGPGYENVAPNERVCSAIGSVPGSSVVDGTTYIRSAYRYDPANKWRNFGILVAFFIGLTFTYLLSSEYITSKKSKGEVLVFRRGHQPRSVAQKYADDAEKLDSHDPGNQLSKLNTAASAVIQEQTAIFHWKDVCYDVKIKKETRRILDHVDGWVKPGTQTALMGVSGAGKTTLLDVLAQRTTMGVIGGDVYVDGRQRDNSFQRKTGYVQQQDLHLATSTVREALNFSALLRQPGDVPRNEKLEYVNEVIKLLDMEEYADAVVGVPGEGLNVEQRKRLTIGVELAARPQLLLFLDEPTSGLDSQTSWAILDLLEKLANHGTAILCTIHQPSAMLFQRFDRLLFLASGGRTVYFGDIGENSSVMTKYFERNGASPCPIDANPAEWMLQVIGAAPGSHSDTDWHYVWRESQELDEVHRHLEHLRIQRPKETKPASTPGDKFSYREFAAHFRVQMWEVQKRVFEQYWRTPSYIYSKALLCVASSLFVGFSFFNAGTTQQSLQNQMFSIFMIFLLFGNLIQQIMPNFVVQRSLYEARERPSKTYSWKAFMLSNLIVEVPWQALMAVGVFFTYYYPVGLYHNAEPTGAVTERGVLFFLFCLSFLLFTSTFSTMIVAAMDLAETASNIAQLMFSLTLIFCGVLVTSSTLPGFWVFMYRVSPFTYIVSGMLSTGVANNVVRCADNEILKFAPRAGASCQEYMEPYRLFAGGYLTGGTNSSMTDCAYCPIDSTNTFLTAVGIDYNNRWRDWGILWVYIIFNVFAALGLYWLVRVPKGPPFWKKKQVEKERREMEEGVGMKGKESDSGSGSERAVEKV